MLPVRRGIYFAPMRATEGTEPSLLAPSLSMSDFRISQFPLTFTFEHKVTCAKIAQWHQPRQTLVITLWWRTQILEQERWPHSWFHLWLSGSLGQFPSLSDLLWKVVKIEWDKTWGRRGRGTPAELVRSAPSWLDVRQQWLGRALLTHTQIILRLFLTLSCPSERITGKTCPKELSLGSCSRTMVHWARTERCHQALPGPH